MRVAVIGSGRATQKSEAYAAARTVGRLLAEHGHTVVCGGRGGVMEAACRGSTEYDGDRKAQRASGSEERRSSGREEQSSVSSQKSKISGDSIALLPGTDPDRANEYAGTAIATGLGNARNALVVLNGDAVIAIGGHTGTLSELGHALDLGRPVAGIETHDCSEFSGFEAVKTPSEAVESVEQRV